MMLPIVTFTSLYPNSQMPRHGIFVEERLRHLVATRQVQATVVAPVPWFPFRSTVFGRFGQLARVPYAETRLGLEIRHPRWPTIPHIGTGLAPTLMALACLRLVHVAKSKFGSRLVIDGHYLYPDGVAAALIGRWLGLPVVLTARGQDVTLWPRFRVPRTQIRWALNSAAQVIAVSDSLHQQLLRLGVPPQKLTTLRNGVDLTRFRLLDRMACRKQTGCDGLTLLSVGNLVAVKNHELTIRALVHLPNVCLRIVGEGPLDGQLRRLAASLAVGHRVTISRNIPQADLVTLYNAVDALVLSSQREGMPNVILESLACGTPVVATAVGGVPEILQDSPAGVLVRNAEPEHVADAIRRILAAPPDPAAVRRHAEKFGWEETIAGLTDILRHASESFVASARNRTPAKVVRPDI